MSVTAMGVVIVAVLLVALLTYLYIRRAYLTSYKGTFLGMATCLITEYVILALLLAGVKIVTDMISVPQGFEVAVSRIVAVISLLIQTTVTVVCMNYSLARFGWNPGTGKLGNIMAFGYGYALVETLRWVTTTFLNCWLMATTINGVGLQAYYDALGEEQFAQFMEDAQYLFTLGPLYYVWMGIERLCYITFFITLAVMLGLIARKLMNKTFLVTLTSWCFAYYLPGLLRAYDIITIDVVVLILEAIITAAAVLFAWQLMKKLTPEDAEKMNQIRKDGVYEALFAPRKKKETQRKVSISAAASSDVKRKMED